MQWTDVAIRHIASASEIIIIFVGSDVSIALCSVPFMEIQARIMNPEDT
jgi:hypothetical protein